MFPSTAAGKAARVTTAAAYGGVEDAPHVSVNSCTFKPPCVNSFVQRASETFQAAGLRRCASGDTRRMCLMHWGALPVLMS